MAIDRQVHIRAWGQTRRKLKILAASLEEPMNALLDRLVVEEAERQNIDLKERA